MNPCDDCTIHDKIYECCGRFPQTGEAVRLTVSSSMSLDACPYFSVSGICGIYETRPHACRIHYCYRYDTMTEIGMGCQALKEHLGNQGEEDSET
jgi:Fe-S-cluster containining protein